VAQRLLAGHEYQVTESARLRAEIPLELGRLGGAYG
jgi:hypothetical protein